MNIKYYEFMPPLVWCVGYLPPLSHHHLHSSKNNNNYIIWISDWSTLQTYRTFKQKRHPIQKWNISILWYEIDNKIDWLYLKANEVILVGGVSVLSFVKRNWAEITTQYTFYSSFIMVDRLGKKQLWLHNSVTWL